PVIKRTRALTLRSGCRKTYETGDGEAVTSGATTSLEDTGAGEAFALALKSAAKAAPNLSTAEGAGGVTTTVVELPLPPLLPPPQAARVAESAAAEATMISFFMTCIPYKLTLMTS
ncbi:MAG: hypothetical protein ACXU8U_03215, partial [Asticcacaulis sp.]